VARRSKNEALRIPTMADFTAFGGAHCRDIYRSLQPGWTCPGCGRSTFEILRWTLRFPRTTHAFEGWVGGYHKHHDHSVDEPRRQCFPGSKRQSFASSAIRPMEWRKGNWGYARISRSRLAKSAGSSRRRLTASTVSITRWPWPFTRRSAMQKPTIGRRHSFRLTA